MLCKVLHLPLGALATTRLRRHTSRAAQSAVSCREPEQFCGPRGIGRSLASHLRGSFRLSSSKPEVELVGIDNFACLVSNIFTLSCMLECIGKEKLRKRMSSMHTGRH